MHGGAFFDSDLFTRPLEDATCRALFGSCAGGCGHFPARNWWPARGKFCAASGQNARTPSVPERVQSRVFRICSRPAPRRRRENDHSPASISSQNPLDCLVREHGRENSRCLCDFAACRPACLATYLPLSGLKPTQQAFVPSLRIFCALHPPFVTCATNANIAPL